MRSAALARLEEATARATSIVESAELKAQEIAGDALRALRDARSLEETVKALRNKVEGYGDRYLVPGISLLDDLAEHFGNLEVGQELKAARDRVKRAVATRRAAACDYVEENRKETAVRFVTDAFNGKVDSILARVKHNNFGQLAQEIRDAYRLVNENGRAFRSARINEDYRDLRLQELKWAVVAHELKLQEREEQRLINEQIREEEKARREIERAMRDASKEEELLRKAMEKATNQLAKASDEQRAKYEGQLAELAARLTEAEEKNQRALSMAQQTRRGHVYIISNLGSFGEHVYKIGLTRRLDPLDRIRELGDSSVPFEFDVHALIFADDAPALEHQLHRHFALHQMNKVNFRKEFFRVELAFIRDELDKLGVSTRWTMLARARDYRESIAIERAIADDPKARTAWLNRQLLLERTIEFARDEEEEAMSPAHYELQAHATSVAT
ncbi:MAG: hypothetical protein JWO05_3924 [Gemmatimonadetes bacterium]|nr:hypothetical protein [Gemmatimonadota bacterium]